MSRNKKAVSKSIFDSLDRAVYAKGEVVENAGQVRWLSLNGVGDSFLIDAKIIEEIAFSNGVRLSLVKWRSNFFLFTVGLEGEISYFGVEEVDVDNSQIIFALYELKPRLNAGPYEIKNLVESGDVTHGEDYVGHSAESILGLYEPVKLYTLEDECDDIELFFFGICINIIRDNLIRTWMESELLDEIDVLMELRPVGVPYRVLSRSVFDVDPTSFFLALYRCLESLYSYSVSIDIKEKLAASHSWKEVSVILEEASGWYPKEDQSIGSLFKYVPASSAKDLFCSLSGKEGEQNETSIDWNVACARSVYRLRNSIVHYRPSHQQEDFSKKDWNKICKLMTGVVFSVYETVYSS